MSHDLPPYTLRGIPKGDPRATCDEPPPEEFLVAVAQFNAREFFDCHETLEEMWNAEPGPRRILYKGILQVGVGCYHLLRGNYRGTLIKLQTGTDYLEAFEPSCIGVDVSSLISTARRLRQALVMLGPEHIKEVDLTLIPVIQMRDHTEEKP